MTVILLVSTKVELSLIVALALPLVKSRIIFETSYET
jgi:hypothetical protein